MRDAGERCEGRKQKRYTVSKKRNMNVCESWGYERGDGERQVGGEVVRKGTCKYRARSASDPRQQRAEVRVCTRERSRDET